MEERKRDHFEIVKSGKAERKGSFLEEVFLIHCSLPRISLEDVDLSWRFLGYSLRAPIFIASITGGTAWSVEFNRRLARVAQEEGVALFLGSLRPAVEKGLYPESYDVKHLAPDVPVLGNIGLHDLVEYPEKVVDFCEAMGFDGLSVHLNPLQEALQPEGNHSYSFAFQEARDVLKGLGFPVVFKETGAGVSWRVARVLRELGVEFVDVSGRGGTSWAQVELLRGGGPPGFEDWGIPTALSILEASSHLRVLASGGIRSGVDGAKALALGAEMFGAAASFLRDAQRVLRLWKQQLRVALYLTDSKTPADLRGKFRLGPTLGFLWEQVKREMG